MLQRVGKPPLHARELWVAIHYQLVRFEMEKITLTDYGKTAPMGVSSDFHLSQQRAASVLQFI